MKILIRQWGLILILPLLPFISYSQVRYFVDAGSGVIRYNAVTETGSYVVFNGNFFLDDIVQDDQGRIYWTDWTKDKIRRANADGSNITNIIAGVDNPKGIAIDPINQKIYWVESVPEIVRRANLDGSNVETILSDLGLPNDIILDPPNNRLFLADRSEGVFSANLDGSNLTYLNDGFGSTTIEYDPSEDKIYYAKSNSGEVKKMDPNGQNVEVIYANSNGQLTGMGFDGVNQKLYLTNGSDNWLARVNLDGSGFEFIYNPSIDVGVAEVFVNPTDNLLYWVEYSTSRIMRSALDGSNVEIIVDSAPWEQIRDIAMSDLNTTLFFIAGAVGKIYTADLEGNNPTVYQDNIPGAGALSYDPYGNKIYWSDRIEKEVWRGNLDGSDKELLFLNVDIQSIDIDPVTQTIYLSDFSENVIWQGSINGGPLSAVDIPFGSTPQDLAVQFMERYLYWTDDDDNEINRINLNNGQNSVFLGPGIPSPNGLDASESIDRIFWTGGSQVQSVNNAGNNLYVFNTEGELFPGRIRIMEPFLFLDIVPDFQIEGMIVCENDGVTVSLEAYAALPPVTYAWSDGFSTNDPVRNDVPAGSYTVTMTDLAMREVEISFEIEATSTFLSAELESNPSNGTTLGSASVNVLGGLPPYQIQWEGNGLTIEGVEEVTELPAGDYTLTITDQNGCVLQLDFTIELQNGMSNVTKDHWELAPTLAKDELFLTSPSTEKSGSIQWEIINLAGQSIKQSSGTIIRIDYLPAGVYYLRISGEGISKTFRFIKV